MCFHIRTYLHFFFIHWCILFIHANWWKYIYLYSYLYLIYSAGHRVRTCGNFPKRLVTEMDWHLEPAQVLSPCPAIFGGVLSVKSPNHLPHNPASGKPGQSVLAILLTQFQQAWMYYTRFQPNIVCIWCNRTVCITIDIYIYISIWRD